VVPHATGASAVVATSAHPGVQRGPSSERTIGATDRPGPGIVMVVISNLRSWTYLDVEMILHDQYHDVKMFDIEIFDDVIFDIERHAI
jgi:hypothetical protein